MSACKQRRIQEYLDDLDVKVLRKVYKSSVFSVWRKAGHLTQPEMFSARSCLAEADAAAGQSTLLISPIRPQNTHTRTPDKDQG